MTTAFRSEFLHVLSTRGFIHQVTDPEGLDALAHKGPITAYVGYDCTANSLHIGNLVTIMMLRWLQKTGHRPVALMGGGTTRIGDPSGKDEARQLLTDDMIAANMASIRRAFQAFLTLGEGPADGLMVNNATWLDNLQYIPLLRDVGRHFSVNRMLTMDSVRLRLEREQPLSFLEFNYMVLQAYDFAELARRHDVALQMGGSDQWGNIIMGVELGRRAANKALYGVTAPLITTSSGAKMGKTAQGAVWLNEDRLSSYDYWQFWRNTEDADVGRFLRLFTDLPLPEVERLEKLGGGEINEAKKVLATEATALCRGRENALAAAETARKTFEQGQSGDALPTVLVPAADLTAGVAFFALLKRAGLVDSNAEARRLIKQNGARLNDETITDDNRPVGTADVRADGTIKLSAGKKRHALVKAG